MMKAMATTTILLFLSCSSVSAWVSHTANPSRQAFVALQAEAAATRRGFVTSLLTGTASAIPLVAWANDDKEEQSTTTMEEAVAPEEPTLVAATESTPEPAATPPAVEEEPVAAPAAKEEPEATLVSNEENDEPAQVEQQLILETKEDLAEVEEAVTLELKSDDEPVIVQETTASEPTSSPIEVVEVVLEAPAPVKEEEPVVVSMAAPTNSRTDLFAQLFAERKSISEDADLEGFVNKLKVRAAEDDSFVKDFEAYLDGLLEQTAQG